MKYLMAHDLGTSENKATLYDCDGVLIGSCVESYVVITLHQGELKIDSKLGEGTVMRLYFPGEKHAVKNKSNRGAKGGR